MKFDHSHYVPVLRWKKGERLALRDLYASDRGDLTPLLELVPSDFTAEKIKKLGGLDAKLAQTADNVMEAWGKAPFFMDLCHLQSHETSDGRHVLLPLGDYTQRIGLNMIPVSGLGRPESYNLAVAALIKNTGSEVCIRLTRNDFRRRGLDGELKTLMSNLDVAPARAHLIIDLQLTVGTRANFQKLFQLVPNLQKWTTLTILSGTFPPDLRNFEVGEHELPRDDFLSWRDQFFSMNNLPRLPAFGDYTTRHPIFSEPPSRANVSASIRYTSDEYWVVMRGEWVNKPGGTGYKQYPANAILLRERSEFCGSSFSEGDAYIAQMDLRSPKTGNATTWVQACTNHHLTFTVRQIRAFSSAPLAAAP